MAAIIDGEEVRDIIIEGVARATDKRTDSVDEKRVEPAVANLHI